MHIIHIRDPLFLQRRWISFRIHSPYLQHQSRGFCIAFGPDTRNSPTDGPGEGYIVESRKHRNMGPVASVIVTLGAVAVRDFVVAGKVYGRV